jgi:hypothetical protein
VQAGVRLRATGHGQGPAVTVPTVPGAAGPGRARFPSRDGPAPPGGEGAGAGVWPGSGAALLLPEADGDWLTLFHVRVARPPHPPESAGPRVRGAARITP